VVSRECDGEKGSSCLAGIQLNFYKMERAIEMDGCTTLGTCLILLTASLKMLRLPNFCYAVRNEKSVSESIFFYRFTLPPFSAMHLDAYH
jgi:hypothetical protein